MPRWMRVIRGMIGTGLTFAAGVGGVASIVGALVWLGGGISGRELLDIAAQFSVASFLLGVAFSGVLAIAARSRQFNALSLRLVGALGAGAGMLYWVFLALTGGRSWDAQHAIGNFALVVVMGAGAAAGTLMIARRAGAALESGGDARRVGAGDEEIVHGRSRARAEVPKR